MDPAPVSVTGVRSPLLKSGRGFNKRCHELAGVRLVPQSLWMPLYRHTERVIGKLDGFHKTVGRCCTDPESPADFLQSLMMMAVHAYQRLFKNPGHARVPLHLDVVASPRPLPFGQIMVQGTGQFIGDMNIKSSARAHVHELASSADSQEWLAVGDGSLQQIKFQFIPGRLHVIDGAMLLAAVMRDRDVPAA